MNWLRRWWQRFRAWPRLLRIGRHVQGDYLKRWYLYDGGDGGSNLLLHVFYRGDSEPYNHDHPWSFVSLIVWGGYWEIDAAGRRRWYGPGRLLRRPAEWQHRVELPPGKKCVTLVWVGPKVRRWGFICPWRGWIHWKEHAKNEAAGLTGCGEG